MNCDSVGTEWLVLNDYKWPRIAWICCEEAYYWDCFQSSVYIYTVSQKKRPTFKLSVTLSNLNRFSKFVHYCKAYKIRYKYQYPPHLRYVATLPWESRNSNFLQIFSGYGRKCKQIAFKCTDFNSSTRVSVYAECIYVVTEYLQYLSVRRHSYFLR